MNHLFGTDGIRGEVGKGFLTKEAVFNLGRTIGEWLKEQFPQGKTKKVLIGKDTRESGEELESALAAGAHLADLEVLRAGVCPTPAVAYLTCALKAHLGLAISASHNPGSDNGIKFFDSSGYKLFPAAEQRIAEIFFALLNEKLSFNSPRQTLKEAPDYIPLYINFVKSSLNGLMLSNLKVVVDCAFGAFSKIAPDVFRELGAEVFTLNDEPDGENINVNCGTLHPQKMAEKILEYKADIGVAFDGDGDRVIIADEKGKILDGDHILALLAQYLKEQRRLPKKTIICTQMSNIGLELWLARLGIKMLRTDVGDKYVLQEMLKHHINLGGEQSGHVIILERTTTGDGLITALEIIKLRLSRRKALSKLVMNFQKFPQVLLNIKVKEKKPLPEIFGLNEALTQGRKDLGESGRLLVRYSGTENLARVMVEGPRQTLVNRVARSLAKVIQDAIGQN